MPALCVFGFRIEAVKNVQESDNHRQGDKDIIWKQYQFLDELKFFFFRIRNILSEMILHQSLVAQVHSIEDEKVLLKQMQTLTFQKAMSFTYW